VIPKYKNELQINVSDMLEDHTYHLRLCHKDDYICAGTGDSTQKEQPVKSAVLRYTRPLPCLCIEGWSAVVDAPRVRVCPFQDRLEELWLGITFDPLEEALLWEPACPVNAVAALCEKKVDGTCVDLPEASQNVSRGKLKFAKVDPRPQLCMKVRVIFSISCYYNSVFLRASVCWTTCIKLGSRAYLGAFFAGSPGQKVRNKHKRMIKLQLFGMFLYGECCICPNPIKSTTIIF
uniref:Interleukin-17 receptor C/E N-terminal domain-containing protein n=1 Tax=Oryzias sinensis TaxID=183150 RepID=A0A8C7ZGL3_9TELE